MGVQPPGPPGPPGPARPRRSRWSALPGPARTIVVTLAVGAVGFGIAYAQGQHESATAPAVGQCAAVVGTDDVKAADCSDPSATLLVTSRHDNTTNGESACAGDEAATSYYTFEERSHDTAVVSFVLCLADR